MTALVEIANLRVVFRGDRGQTMHAVETVNFELARGVTLGLVGESGCGKSVTALAIMGLLPKGSADVSGHVGFEGNNLLDLTDMAMRDLRGDRLAMIFQEPMTSLNPAYTIGEQIIETLVRHRGLNRAQARAARSSFCETSEFRRPNNEWTNIRTSFPAACASARWWP